MRFSVRLAAPSTGRAAVSPHAAGCCDCAGAPSLDSGTVLAQWMRAAESSCEANRARLPERFSVHSSYLWESRLYI